MENITYKEILKKYSSWINNCNYSEGVQVNYITIAKNLFLYLENFNVQTLNEVSLDHLIKFAYFRGEKAYVPKFVAVRLSALALFYKWAYKNKYCRSNLINEYKKAKINGIYPPIMQDGSLSEKELLILEEQERLFKIGIKDDFLEIRNKCIVLLILGSALFAEEVINLPKTALNLKKGYLDVKDKNQEGRQVQLDLSLCKDACVKWLAIRNKYTGCQNLFITRSNMPLTKRMLYKVVSQFLLKAGVKKKHSGPEILRQTAICNMVKKGLTLEEIQINTGLITVGQITKYKKFL